MVKKWQTREIVDVSRKMVPFPRFPRIAFVRWKTPYTVEAASQRVFLNKMSNAIQVAATIIDEMWGDPGGVRESDDA